MAIQVTATALPEVKIIEPKVFGDARGYFYESFNGREFSEQVETGVEFVQDNHSRSARGVLRGLHYQIEHAQGKLVRVVEGEVFDVLEVVRLGKDADFKVGQLVREIVAPRLGVADLFVEINDEQRHVASAFSPGAQRHQIHDEGQSDSRDSVISIPRRLAVHFWRFAMQRRKVCGVS